MAAKRALNRYSRPITSIISNNRLDSTEAIRGLDAWKHFISIFHRAFPDFEDRIVMQIAEGDMVATQFVSGGTQNGEIMGVPATGRKASWTGIVIDRIANGKIAETWINWDKLGMLQQLGAGK